MNILRTLVKTNDGQDFLIDAEHSEKKIGLLKIHPIVNGEIRQTIPPCHFDNVNLLVEKMHEILEQI